MNHEVSLPGCVSSVLGSYLKALAVHRLVAEQADGEAVSWWNEDGVFFLRSSLDRDALATFLARDYVPTPIVTPWNGGSGFFPQDQQAGIVAVEGTADDRFSVYRQTIAACRTALADLGIREKPDKEKKARLLERLRSRLPDAAIGWLDAAFVVTEQPRYAPILGTGGNDGRLDFGNNFLQRLAELFLETKGHGTAPSARDRLKATLFGDVLAGACDQAAVGQFAPGRAGGSNMTTGFNADARVNPWDFVLALEGAIAFAGAAVRRLEVGRYGSAAFPFHVNSSAIGYGASANTDREASRAELWLPFWPAPTTFPELRSLFAEGRLELHGRRARTGLDAARALAALGVDRGLDRFERIGLLRRNGRMYLASSLGIQRVQRVESVDLFRDLDRMIADVERLEQAPSSVASALRQLEERMFDACRMRRPLTSVLQAAAVLERAVSRSGKARQRVRPLRGLSEAWYEVADDHSPEFAIASAVATWGVRGALEPVDDAGQRWTDDHPIWTQRGALENIVGIARRRLLNAEQGFVPLAGRSAVSTDALSLLLRGTVDEIALTELVSGLSLLPSWALRPPAAPRVSVEEVDAIMPWFGLLRAVCSPRILAVEGRHPSPPVISAILAHLAAWDLAGALTLAERRLRASGCRLLAPLRAVSRDQDCTAVAAALVIPLPDVVEHTVVARVVDPSTWPSASKEVSRACV